MSAPPPDPSDGHHEPFAVDRRWRWFAGVLSLCLVAVMIRFVGGYRLRGPEGTSWGVADDVYISADFARTFIEGDGLLWYAGAPKVEGFTNPLWVAILSLIQMIPGFDEDHLGLYVASVNGLVMIALSVVLVRCVGRVAPALPLSAGRSAAAIALATAACPSLCFCAGIGFETALVALLSLTAFHESLAEKRALRPALVAALVGLAFWTRMDALLTCVPALATLLFRCRDHRKLGAAALVLAALVSSLFLLRRWYYSDWFPNTYYLKATGWPFAEKLAQGLIWNAVPLAVFLAVAVPGWLLVRRRLGPAALPVAVALSTYLATVLYSSSNGGDVVYAFGLDRFSAVGCAFLAFALAAGAVAFRGGPLAKTVALVAGLLLGSGAIWVASPRESVSAFGRFLNLRRHPLTQDVLVKRWIHEGKMLREFTNPGARVALCGAGALVYFSHRGGVDILGKIEPLVAHQKVPREAPPEARCWRGFPGAGHNKEDLRGVFTARRPELSVLVPPDAHRKRYVVVRYRDTEFFALKSTRYIDWQKVTVLPTRREPRDAPRVPQGPSTGWTGLGRGVTTFRSTRTDSTGAAVTWVVVRADLDAVRVHAMEPAKRRLEAFTEHPSAIFAVNGGYFEPGFEPSGLLLEDGRVVSRWQDRGGSGALVVSGNRASVVSGPPAETASLELAVQCGPRLVEPGGVLGMKSDDGRHAERTAACVRRGGRELNFVIAAGPAAGSGPTLYQFAEWLRAPLAPGESTGCDAALNLDGGPSTGVVAKGFSQGEAVQPRGPVPWALVATGR